MAQLPNFIYSDEAHLGRAMADAGAEHPRYFVLAKIFVVPEPERLAAAVDDYVRVRKSLVASTEDWRELDLTMAQLRCLVELYRSGELSVRGLAEVLGTGLPAASLLSERVVQAGLVERRHDLGDRRRVLLRLTAAGQETAFRIYQGRMALLTKWLSAMPATDFDALARGLSALADVASLETSPA